MKFDYIVFFAATMLTVAMGQTLDSTTTHLMRFLHGVLVGTSIGALCLDWFYTRDHPQKAERVPVHMDNEDSPIARGVTGLLSL